MILGFMDPCVLVCPPNIEEEEVIIAYVERLIAWRDLREQGWIQVVLPRTTPELLAETNGYPPWEVLTEVLSRKDLGIQAVDVFTLMDTLLTKGPTVEDLTGIAELIVEDTVCSPDYFSARAEEHRVQFARLLGMISIYQKEGNLRQGFPQILTVSAPCPHQLDFSTSLLAIEYEDREKEMFSLPIRLQGRLIGVCCAEHSFRQADPLAIWEVAETDSDYRTLIHLYVHQYLLGKKTVIPTWRLGSRFASSIKSMHIRDRATGAKVLRACAQTILGQNLEATHALRTSIGGNSPQVKRGQDGAIRRDIDYELHLHYWVTSEGPELASVVVHNDFSIAKK